MRPLDQNEDFDIWRLPEVSIVIKWELLESCQNGDVYPLYLNIKWDYRIKFLAKILPKSTLEAGGCW